MLLWALVVACACVVTVQSLTLSEAEVSFKEFIVKYNKGYDADAYNQRLNIFKKNLEYIEASNAKNTHMTLGINQFADLTHEEYLEFLQPPQTFPVISRSHSQGQHTVRLSKNRSLPDSVDWRNISVVGPVKEAQACDRPAYSAVGCIEAFCAITAGKLQDYDPEQVARCITSCSEDEAWKYIGQKGLHPTWNSTCSPSPTSEGCCINDYLCFGSGSEFVLQTAVGVMGPISVTIDGSHDSFKAYQNGIYYEPQCNSSNLNLNLLVVGYGVTGKQEYWIAQNSFGQQWGVKGYILMARNQGNNCGIASHQCHPIAVHACGKPSAP